MGTYYGSEGAGLGYFPLLYITKLQIGYHLAVLASIVFGAVSIKRSKLNRLKEKFLNYPEISLIIIYCLGFGAIAVGSTLQLGLRHIMPVVFGVACVSGLALDNLISSVKNSISKYLKSVLVLGAIVMIYILFHSRPYFISYYNALAGGTNKGYRVATDSNYDWGQDIKALSQWQKDNNIKSLRTDLFVNPFLPTSYFLDNSLGYKIETDPPLKSGTYLAVSLSQYQINTHKKLPLEKTYEKYKDHQVAKVGKTILVFKVP
jgi:hypothetical protein